MLKYLYSKIVFSEIPDEIILGISLTGCTIHCQGCHSQELWEDTGTPLTIEELDNLLNKNIGVTCLLLLGGEHDIDGLTELFMHAFERIKTAWYCGLDKVPRDKQAILQYLDYLKVGHYDGKLGGLSSPTTNQHLYLLEHQGEDHIKKIDITKQLQAK